MGISVVVNTRNEEEHIENCLKSLTWADEIVVYDANSTDKTREIAAKFTDKIFTHNDTSGYVETQRNGAIEKATQEWVLVVDCDEEIPQTLAEELKRIVKSIDNSNDNITYYGIPRRNTIFGKVMEHTGWWPDYHIRFFKKGSVTWTDEIHVPPKTAGNGAKLEAKHEFALNHSHYISISQYLTRLNKYTDIQAKEVTNKGYTFAWQDFIRKPLSEFLTRFFVWEGYKDGVHGLALSMLQAFSFFLVYLKIWEQQKFPTPKSDNFLSEVEQESQHVKTELTHWFRQSQGKKQSVLKKFFQ